MNNPSNSSSIDDSQPVHDNPPGLSEIAYREGTYATVLQRLINRLATQQNEQSDLPVLYLNTEQPGNWVLSLLEAWAMVVDVLTFYQERIANEGYLRTAQESRSVRYLTRAVGYEPYPGTSASTYLAFTVRVGKNEPPRHCILPRGLAVQSVPTQGQRTVSLPDVSKPPEKAALPQIFETSAELIAYSEWNAMQPITRANRPGRTLRAGSTSLRLAGIKTGLHVGDPLLIIGDAGTMGTANKQDVAWLFTLVETIEIDTAHNLTSIGWSHALGDNQQDSILHNPAVYSFQQQAKLYGYTRGGVSYTPLDTVGWSPSSIGLPNSAIHALIVQNTGTLFVATDSGVFRSNNGGANWEFASTGLMRMKIYALTIADNSTLYAGSSTGKLFTSVDNGDTWQLVISSTVRPRGLLALAAWLSLPRPASQALPSSIIRSLATYSEGQQKMIAVAMDSGVFVSADGGRLWQQPPDSGPEATPRIASWTFAAKASGQKPLVGMNRGVFPISGPNWRTWAIPLSIVVLVLSVILFVIGLLTQLAELQPTIGRLLFQSAFFESLYPSLFNISSLLLFIILLILAVAAANTLFIALTTNHPPQNAHPLPTVPVKALTFGSDGTLFAGSKDGLFRSSDNGLNWAKLAHTPTGSIQAIATNVPNAPGTLLIGMEDGQLYRSHDNGENWEAINHNLHLSSVDALMARENGLFAAGQPDSTKAEEQWSRFQVQERQLVLDRAYAHLQPDTWLVLQQDEHVATYHASTVSSIANQDYKKSTPLSSLVVDNAAPVADFDRATTTVYTGVAPLSLFDDDPIQGARLTFDRFVPELVAGKLLIISGKRLRLRVPASSLGGIAFVSATGAQEQPGADTSFEVLAATTSAGSAENTETRWQVRDRNGYVGTIAAPISDVNYELAQDDDETISEAVILQEVTTSAQTTVLLQEPLQNIYDRSTVKIYGNVVQATHGQTVENEVLGSTSKQNTYHLFTLKYKPLSFLSVMNAESNIPALLSVIVNNMPWHRVASANLDQSTRGYSVRQDEQQNTQILFGNGWAGTPPRGNENISATYRYGSGVVGNVPAGSLQLLRTRPPAIQAVTNPIAATGGTDPEATDVVRMRAPRHLQAIQRVVSLSDYQQFARIAPGIGKVQAKMLWQGRSHLLLLTVTGEQETKTQDNLQSVQNAIQALRAAINSATAAPAQPLVILPYEPLSFQLTVNLVLDRNYSAYTDSIKAHVQQALNNAFGFAQRKLSQSVSSAEVVQVIQGVTSVLAVELTALHLRGQPAAFHDVLPAASGRLENGTLQAAQLLLIDTDADNGQRIQVE